MAAIQGETRLIDGHPCLITGGYYLDPVYNRVSNHFNWRRINRDGTLQKEESSGYGGDWPLVRDAVVIKRVKIPAATWRIINFAKAQKKKKAARKKK